LVVCEKQYIVQRVCMKKAIVALFFINLTLSAANNNDLRAPLLQNDHLLKHHYDFQSIADSNSHQKASTAHKAKAAHAYYTTPATSKRIDATNRTAKRYPLTAIRAYGPRALRPWHYTRIPTEQKNSTAMPSSSSCSASTVGSNTSK